MIHEDVIGAFTWHGTEIHSCDFGEFGTFQLSAIASTTFDVVESDYRWHTCKATGKIDEGTGVFAEAQGVFDLNGYTQWFTDGSAPPTAWYCGSGRVFGISAVPEPLGLTVASIGLIGLLADIRKGMR